MNKALYYLLAYLYTLYPYASTYVTGLEKRRLTRTRFGFESGTFCTERNVIVLSHFKDILKSCF